MKILALIPAFNEADSLPQVVEELRRLRPSVDILIVDDASSDRTAAVLPQLGVRWLRLCTRMGVGSAIRAGLRWAQPHGYDGVVRLDADGQHPADLLEALLSPLVEGRADAVVGSRYKADRGGYRGPWPRRLALRLLAVTLSLLMGKKVTDPTSGFWAFGPDVAALLAQHHPTGYGEPELRLFLHRNGFRVEEVSTPMRDRFAGRTSLTFPRALLAVARALLAMVVVPLSARQTPR